jgi:hypothetical protein
MTDDEKYVRDAIHVWVWSGFYGEAETKEMMEEILDGDVDAVEMQRFIASEFALKAVAERSWPKETDCDRLDRVFAALDAAGICSLQSAGYTMSDGHEDIGQKLDERGMKNFRGYCFYHGQDLDRAVNGQGLMLAFSDLKAEPVAKTKVGYEICALLEKEGFKTDWSGDPEKRINVPKIDWKRRTPR